MNNPVLYITFIVLLLTYGVMARRHIHLPKIQLGFFILFCFLKIAGYYAGHFPGILSKPILDVLALLALCFGIIRNSITLFIEYVIGPKKAITIPAITRDVVLVVLYLIVVMIVLREKLNIDVTSLVATSAILTAVIGLALQDTLGNLFSGLALNIEKPYKLGDWVNFDKYKGQIHGINWRSTILLTPEHEMIVVPNNVISRSHIVNYSDPSTLLISSFNIGIDYNVPPNKVSSVILAVLKKHPRVLADKPMEVRLVSYDAYSIQYQVRYWIDIIHGGSDTTKSDIMKRLWYQLRRENVSIPYPVQVEYQGEKISGEASLVPVKTFLQNIEFFQTLSPIDRDILVQSIIPLQFAGGEVIFNQDAAGETMYIITEGECDIRVKNAIGKEKSVSTLMPGDFFGEMSLMTGDPRKATIIAKTDTLLYEIAKGPILKLLEANPKLSEIFSEHLARRENERLKVISELETTEKFEVESPPTAKQILQKIKAFFRI